MNWHECVVEITDHGIEDEKVMKEIEKKLKAIVRDIEMSMSVCETCYNDEFKKNRTELYVKTVKDVTKKHNEGQVTDLSFLLKK